MLLKLVPNQLHVTLLPKRWFTKHSGLRQAGENPPSVLLWARYTHGLGLSFLICNTGTITGPPHSTSGRGQWDNSYKGA